MARKSKDRDLLVAVLGGADCSALPPEVRDAVNEWVADYGGCAFCDKPAALLCDFLLGFGIAGWTESNAEQAAKVGRLEDLVDGKLPYTDIESEQFTCDAPLCESCAERAGGTFWSGELGGYESRDICPSHQGKADSFGAGCCTPEHAEKMRRLAWKMRVFS